MTYEPRHLDGNGLAGVLADVFGPEATRLPRRCGDCGMESALGAHRAYRSAGWVLRCPGCDAVALRIGVFDDAVTVTWSGVMTVRPPA